MYHVRTVFFFFFFFFEVVGLRGVVLLLEKEAEDKDSCIINPIIERWYQIKINGDVHPIILK